MKRFWTTLGLVVALGSGIYVIGTTSGSAPAADTANLWVAVGGNGTNCVRSAGLVADPNPVTDCATMDAAYDLASAGDTIKVTCQAATSTCTDTTQVITGTHASAGCNTSTEAGCIQYLPAQGKSVAYAAITIRADYVKLKDLTASDSNLTVNGSVNFDTATCTTNSERTDGVLENVSMAQLGMLGGYNNIWVKNSDVGGRRNDASQWFPCNSLTSTQPIPSNILVEGTTFHDYHMTGANSCASSGGFTYTAPLATTSSTGGTLTPGTYTYTVRAVFRQVGDTVGTGVNQVACRLGSVNVTVPAGTNTNKVTLNWTDPNTAWTYIAGYDVFGRSSTALGTCPTAQYSGTKLGTFYPASYAAASLRTTTTFTDDGSVTPPATSCTSTLNPDSGSWVPTSSQINTFTGPQNVGDIHMECIHIDGGRNIILRKNRFYNCGQYNISFSRAANIGPWTVENNWFGGPSGGNDVVGGSGVINTIQWDLPGFAQTGTTTNTSTSVTGLSSTIDMAIGDTVTATTGIAAGTTIANVDSSTAITLSATATATGSRSLTFSNRVINRYNTYDGTVGWLVPSEGFPAGAHFYGNLARFSYSSAFFCNIDKNSTGMTLEYTITAGAIACGTGSNVLASAPTVNTGNGTSAINLHLSDCTSIAANFVPTSLTDTYPSTDYDGDTRPNGGGSGTKVDAGADEACA